MSVISQIKRRPNFEEWGNTTYPPIVESRRRTLVDIVQFPSVLSGPQILQQNYSRGEKSIEQVQKDFQREAREVITKGLDFLIKHAKSPLKKIDVLKDLLHFFHEKRIHIAKLNGTTSDLGYFKTHRENYRHSIVTSFKGEIYHNENEYINILFNFLQSELEQQRESDFSTVLEEGDRIAMPTKLSGALRKEFAKKTLHSPRKARISAELSSSHTRQALLFKKSIIDKVCKSSSGNFFLEPFTEEEQEKIWKIFQRKFDLNNPDLILELENIEEDKFKLWNEEPELYLRFVFNILVNNDSIRNIFENQSKSSYEIVEVTLLHYLDQKKIPLSRYLLIDQKKDGSFEQNRKILLSHTDPIFFKPIFDELGRIFEKILECDRNDISEIQKLVGTFVYLYSHMCPFMRGSSAIGEWLETTLYLYHGFSLKDTRYSSNIHSLLSPFNSFIQEYCNCIELGKVTDDQISRIFCKHFPVNKEFKEEDDEVVFHLKQLEFECMSKENILDMIKKSSEAQLQYAWNFLSRHPEKREQFLSQFIQTVDSEEIVTDQLIDWLSMLSFLPHAETILSNVLRKFADKDPDFLGDFVGTLKNNALHFHPNFHEMIDKISRIFPKKKWPELSEFLLANDNDEMGIEEWLAILKLVSQCDCDDFSLSILMNVLLMNLQSEQLVILLPICVSFVKEKRNSKILEFFCRKDFLFPHLAKEMSHHMLLDSDSFKLFYLLLQKATLQDTDRKQLEEWFVGKEMKHLTDLKEIFTYEWNLAFLKKDRMRIQNIINILNAVCTFDDDDLKGLGKNYLENLQQLVLSKLAISLINREEDDIYYIVNTMLSYPEFFSKTTITHLGGYIAREMNLTKPFLYSVNAEYNDPGPKEDDFYEILKLLKEPPDLDLKTSPTLRPI